MAIDLERWKRLKTAVDGAATEKARAEGGLLQLMQRLGTEFACPTKATALAKQTELDATATDLEAQYAAALKELEDEFPDLR